MSGPLHTVHVRVNDAATGQPTPVRIRFTGPDGEYLAPFGRLARFDAKSTQSLESADFEGSLQCADEPPAAYIDGSCEIALPAGPIGIDVTKGAEYRPLNTVVELPPGKLALRFTIDRWINLRRDRWFSGDVAVRRATPHAALLEGAAEDLAVINVLSGNTGRLTAFSGQRPALEMPGHIVTVNTFNTHRTLGYLALLNCHRIVYPLHFGAPEGADNWTLADWCDQCHRKGGLAVWCARYWTNGPPWGGEALAEVVLGKVDAVELAPPYALGLYDIYSLLDCNLHVPLVGGSHKANHHEAVGTSRTYARLAPGEAFTYKNWIEAVRAGRTFVTRGPLLDLTVNGQDIGATVEASDGKITIRAEAQSLLPFERLEIVVNGAAVAAVEATGTPPTALIEGQLDMLESGWMAARCWGARPTPADDHASICLAHTSPVYVQVPGRAHVADPIRLAHLTDKLNQTLTWAEHEARYENDKQREQLTGIFKSACAELVRRAGGS